MNNDSDKYNLKENDWDYLAVLALSPLPTWHPTVLVLEDRLERYIHAGHVNIIITQETGAYYIVTLQGLLALQKKRLDTLS